MNYRNKQKNKIMKNQIQQSNKLKFTTLEEEIKFRKIFVSVLKTNCQNAEHTKLIENYEEATRLKEVRSLA